jgi:four helix bundle protein
MLSFQRMDVYRCAVELLALSSSVKAPRGQGELGDQLRGAALSIPLNIAEAAGKVSPGYAARHYAIARGSAMECAAIFDAFQILAAIEHEQHTRANELLGRLVAMLTKLA